jgi:hypothetical protein
MCLFLFCTNDAEAVVQAFVKGQGTVRDRSRRLPDRHQSIA